MLKEIKTVNWRGISIALGFSIAALVVGIIGVRSESITMQFIAPAYALALLSAGFGYNGLVTALRTDKKMNEMTEILGQIVESQAEIQKKQEEQANPRSPIIASLQGLSQLYLDYVARQKREDEEDQ